MMKSVPLTDPARELAELCTALQAESAQSGEKFLAEHFTVVPWSREFFEIVFTITERCGMLQDIVGDLGIDEDFQAEMVAHVSAIMAAFSAQAMRAQWKDFGNKKLSPVNVGPLKALSALVRQRVAYRRLEETELAEILSQTANLLEWLEEHQLEDQDFIRQAMIDGVERFQFRLERLSWVGWGYTLDSLRDVIAAYMLLEREGIDPQTHPNAAAILKKVGGVIQAVYQKVATAKDMAETGDWLLKAYGAGSLVYQAGRPLIAGLLT